jgi:ferric-dicitrate binding protein FerR (iron transport regulator)
MEKTLIYQLVGKYLNNEATMEEVERLNEWYRTAHKDQVEWPASFPGEEQVIRDRMWQRMQEQIAAASSQRTPPLAVAGSRQTSPSPERARSGKVISRPHLWAAACVLLLICIGAFFGLRHLHRRGEEWITVHSPTGRIVKFSLPDSSEVWLNAGSELRYRQNFGSNREIRLVGAAFFNVRPMQGKPFQVHSNGLVTRVLGTSFAVTAYAHSHEMRVAVQSGKVSVSSEQDKKELGILLPEQELLYNKSSSTAHTRRTPAGELSWTKGQLVFDAERLEEIADRLENWYGVSIAFANPALKTCQYTASFDGSTRLDNLLELLCEINNIRFSIDPTGRKVTLSGNGCN